MYKLGKDLKSYNPHSYSSSSSVCQRNSLDVSQMGLKTLETGVWDPSADTKCRASSTIYSEKIKLTGKSHVRVKNKSQKSKPNQRRNDSKQR